MADLENEPVHLVEDGRSILRSGGSIKMADAKSYAEGEYEKFDSARKLVRRQEADRQITELTAEAKRLPHKRARKR